MADKTIMGMLTQLASMELFYIIGGSTVFIIILSLIIRPLVNGIVTLRECCRRRAPGPPSAPPILTGFTLAQNKVDPDP